VDYANRQGNRDVVHALQDEEAIAKVLADLAARKKKQEDAAARPPTPKDKKHRIMAKPEEPEEPQRDTGRQEVVAYLLNMGADPDLKDMVSDCGAHPCALSWALTCLLGLLGLLCLGCWAGRGADRKIRHRLRALPSPETGP